MIRRVIFLAGLTNFSGMRRTSTSAASGREVSVSSSVPKRPNLRAATLVRPDVVPVHAGPHVHNALMTLPSDDAPGSARAARMGAMLLGMGTLHFVAPKPFDGIIPAELPGSARFYTYASGVAELGTGT